MPIVLFQIFLHTDPGPRNDQRPAGNLFAHRETRLAFARHSFSLSLDPQEMSLNIDMHIILPVKFSGVSSNLNSKRFDFITELQRFESWENIPLEVHRLTVDSVKISLNRK